MSTLSDIVVWSFTFRNIFEGYRMIQDKVFVSFITVFIVLLSTLTIRNMGRKVELMF